MKNSTRETGTRYEEKAALFLEQQGYRILEKNFRCRKGDVATQILIQREKR